jgi:hypothetical protein
MTSSMHSLSIGLLFGLIIPRVIEGAGAVWFVLIALTVFNMITWLAYLYKEGNHANNSK